MVHTRLPGLGIAVLGGAAALLVHAVVPPLSPTLVAIALGIVVAGCCGGMPERARPGLRVASRHLLRLGVALLGLQLLLPQILDLGWPVLVVVAGVVVIGIAGTVLLARVVGVPADQALLVACGFSICGAAAVGAVEGVRRSKDEDVATAVSLVVVFGSVAMLVIPLVALGAGFSPTEAGAWSGASIHEVGQVVVAGGIVGGAAAPIAVAVKLGRVLMLAPVLAAISLHSRRAAAALPAGGSVRRPPLVPAFVVAFAACAAVRTFLPVPGQLLDVAAVVQAGALATAMFALGCGVEPAALRRTGRPVLVLACGATALVALLGLPAAFVAA